MKKENHENHLQSIEAVHRGRGVLPGGFGDCAGEKAGDAAWGFDINSERDRGKSEGNQEGRSKKDEENRRMILGGVAPRRHDEAISDSRIGNSDNIFVGLSLTVSGIATLRSQSKE